MTTSQRSESINSFFWWFCECKHETSWICPPIW